MWIFEVYLAKEYGSSYSKRVEILVTAFDYYQGFLLSKNEELISTIDKCYYFRLLNFDGDKEFDFDDPLWAKYKNCEDITENDIDVSQDGIKLNSYYYASSEQKNAISEVIELHFPEFEDWTIVLTLDFRDRDSELDNKYYALYKQKSKKL